ncbi:MAG: hypothetical protein QM654_13985 [Dysgonamonadaceae bacterium]
MDIQTLRDKLPYGAQIEIAKRTNYSETSISLFFNGKKNLCRYLDVLNAATDILLEQKKKEKKIAIALNKSFNL